MKGLGLAVLTLLPIPLFGQTKPVPQLTDDANRLVSEGTKLLMSGQTDEAIESFRKARTIAPDDIEAIIGSARAECLKPELHGQAQADYEVALSIRPSGDLYSELAFALYIAGGYPAAITASKKALSLNPDLLAAEMVYGNALRETGNLDSAIGVFSKACVQSRAAHPEANGACGVYPVIPFRPETVVSISSARAWTYFKKASVLDPKGDCPTMSLAEKDFIEAVSFEPKNPDLHDRLGTVLMAEGSPNLANCARSQSEGEDYLDRAWYQFRAAVNLDSKNTLYRGQFVILSEVLKRRPEYDAGVATEPNKTEWQQFLTEHPEVASSDSVLSLGSLQDAQFDAEHKKALADAKEAVRLTPTDGYAWFSLGKAYMALQDYMAAEEPLQRALKAWEAAPAPIVEDLEKYRAQRGESKGNVEDIDISGGVKQRFEMIAYTYLALADVCDHLNRKREAKRYRSRGFFIVDQQRERHSAASRPSAAAQQRTFSVEQQGGLRQNQTKPLPRSSALPCPLPVHETCQMPPFTPQPYDPNNPQPYKAPDTRDYERCVLGNQREDARYQQCLQQQ